MTIEMPALIGVGFLLFRFLGLRQTPCQSEILKVPRFFCVGMCLKTGATEYPKSRK